MLIDKLYLTTPVLSIVEPCAKLASYCVVLQSIIALDKGLEARFVFSSTFKYPEVSF